MKLSKTMLVLSSFALGGQAHAAVIYTNEADFIAALGGVTTLEDFNDSILASPLTSIVSTNGAIQGNRFSDTLTQTSASTTFNFSSEIRGFGGIFNLSPGGGDQGIAFLLNGVTPLGDSSFEIPNGNGNSFWGFVSDFPLTSVKLIAGTQSGNENHEAYNLDNLRFGGAGGGSATPPVPEPATWAMMLVGFGAIGVTMRRRKQPPRVRFAC